MSTKVGDLEKEIKKKDEKINQLKRPLSVYKKNTKAFCMI